MYFRVLRGRCLTLSVIVSVSASVYPLNSYPQWSNSVVSPYLLAAQPFGILQVKPTFKYGLRIMLHNIL